MTLSNSSEPGADSRSGRRGFLQGAVGASLGAVALMASPAMARGSHHDDSMKGYFDVTNYGAKGDGVQDDAPAIQTAITAAGEHGGIVWLPPGSYLLGSGLLIPRQIIMAGAGWDTGANGSWLHVASTSFVPITVTGRGVTFRDLAIRHEQPKPGPGWQPAPYPTAILVQADDSRFENIMLLNPTIGITSMNAGRMTISRLWGEPLLTGISIDNAEDVVKVDNVHFWVFWNHDESVSEFKRQNGVMIASFRNDNPHFSNIFGIGYKAGFYFSRSKKGITSKFRIVNADTDVSTAGIVIDGSSTTGQISNYTFQGLNKPEADGAGIQISADNVTLFGSNVRISKTGGSAIQVAGKSTVIMDGLWLQNWDALKSGAPAIEASVPEATVNVGFGRLFTGSESPQTGGAGKVLLAGQ